MIDTKSFEIKDIRDFDLDQAMGVAYIENNNGYEYVRMQTRNLGSLSNKTFTLPRTWRFPCLLEGFVFFDHIPREIRIIYQDTGEIVAKFTGISKEFLPGNYIIPKFLAPFTRAFDIEFIFDEVSHNSFEYSVVGGVFSRQKQSEVYLLQEVIERFIYNNIEYTIIFTQDDPVLRYTSTPV